MKTIIIDCSPKGKSKNCNSRIISEALISEMKNPCEIKSIAEEAFTDLANYIANFDTIIFVLPLYIHAMPGIMMEFIEHLHTANTSGKSMGFIVQAGFIETEQEKYVVRYFEALTRQL